MFKIHLCRIGELAFKRLISRWVEENHISFGLTFRHQFTKLRTSLFQYLVNTNHPENTNCLPSVLHLPLLLMTATCNPKMVELLEKMIGLRILPDNYFWCGCKEMERRSVKLSISNTPQHFRILKNIFNRPYLTTLTKRQ